MLFLPATRPPTPASPQAWCFAFVGNQLLLPENGPADLLTDAPGLQPLEPAALRAEASAQHYLGTLAGHDCWALLLPAAPPGWVSAPR